MEGTHMSTTPAEKPHKGPAPKPLVNAAAWLPALHEPLEVKDASYTRPAEGQVVVRAHAVAVNPLDWIIQDAANLIYRWLDFPTVLGCDVAGELVEVGPGVTRLKVGDRVLAHAVGSDKDVKSAAEGTFQEFVVVLERMTSQIPDALAYEDATVLPLGISTAASGLFQKDFLGLAHPAASPKPTGQTVLVWGGSTSVGSNAIQLAHAAGYEVITTASPHNFDYVKALGAAKTFDYHSPNVVDDIVAALKGKKFAGAIAFGTTSAEACVSIACRANGKRFVALATPPVAFDGLASPKGRGRETRSVMKKMVASNVALQLRARRGGVKIKYIFGTSLKNNEVSQLIYDQFLPAALADGRYQAAPKGQVVGNGLQHLQQALDLQRKGVSAAKVVVTMP